MEDQDVVIIGAGAAGCVLAARLSQDPSRKVLLVDPGGANEGPEFSTPGRALGLIGGSSVRATPTVPQAAVAGRVVALGTGRGLGGGTSVNAMWWAHGHPSDYADWEAAGAAGWGWDEVLPVFRDIEDHELGASAFHGAGGPMAVSSPRHSHPLSAAFLEAGVAAGATLVADLNGAQRTGVGLPWSTIRDGVRHSVVDGYLRPAAERDNLTVMTGHQVSQVILDNGRAVGVRVVRDGAAHGAVEVRARQSVVLAAGAVSTPQLLMLSGIGPGDHLAEHGIPVLHDLPGVGQGLQDHPAVVVPWGLREPLEVEGAVAEAERAYALLHRGPLSSLGQGLAALSLTGSAGPDDAPDVHLCASVTGPAAGLERGPFPEAFCFAALVSPVSRGSVALASADPMDLPVVDPRYLADGDDRARLREALRTCLRWFASTPLQQVVTSEPLAPLHADDQQGLDAFIDQTMTTYYHPVGTARMGLDAGSVVSPGLAVHGVTGLFIADASVMPKITRGNTQAPTIMIAERASRLIGA